MVALDFDMTGVQPQGEFTELPEGKYMIRIEWTEKKAVKDKTDPTTGMPAAGNGKNFYLQVDLKIYGGDHDGRTEKEILNLWNINEDAVRIARQTLKSIFVATGVETAESSHLHGRWMMLEVKLNKVNKLAHYYSAVENPAWIPANVPPPVPPVGHNPNTGQPPYAGSPAPAQPPAPAAPVYAPAPAAAPVGYVAPTPPPAAPAAPAAAASAPAAGAAPGQVPAWAMRKS